jgi:hypothetical protein
LPSGNANGSFMTGVEIAQNIKNVRNCIFHSPSFYYV